MRLNTQSKAFAVSTRTTQMEEGFVIIEQRNKSSEKTATHIFLITLFLTDIAGALLYNTARWSILDLLGFFSYFFKKILQWQ